MAVVGPLKLNFQILNEDHPAIGPGKALVLEAIEQEGSISAAGRSLGMSYRRIWLLVESLNTDWRERVVETRIGGGLGQNAGARLTPFGKILLAHYRAIEQRMLAVTHGRDLDWLLAARKIPA